MAGYSAAELDAWTASRGAIDMDRLLHAVAHEETAEKALVVFNAAMCAAEVKLRAETFTRVVREGYIDVLIELFSLADNEEWRTAVQATCLLGCTSSEEFDTEFRSWGGHRILCLLEPPADLRIAPSTWESVRAALEGDERAYVYDPPADPEAAMGDDAGARALEWALELRADLERIAVCAAAATLTPETRAVTDPTEEPEPPTQPTALPQPAAADRDAVCDYIVRWVAATPLAGGERVTDVLLGCLADGFPASVISRCILKGHDVGTCPPVCKQLFSVLCRAVTASCADGVLRLAAATAIVSTQLSSVWSDELGIPHLAAEVKAERFATNHRFNPSKYRPQLACHIPSIAEKLQFVEDPARIASLLDDLLYRVGAQPGRAEEAAIREEMIPVLRGVFVNHAPLRRSVAHVYRALCCHWGATAVPAPSEKDTQAQPPAILADELFTSQAFADCLSFIAPGLAASVAGDPADLVEACATVVRFVGQHNRVAAGWLVVQPTLQRLLEAYKHHPSGPLQRLLLQVSPLIPQSSSVEELLLALPSAEDDDYDIPGLDETDVALSPKKDEFPPFGGTGQFNSTNGSASPSYARVVSNEEDARAARAEMHFLAASLRMRGVADWQRKFAEACGFATILDHLRDRGAGEIYIWDRAPHTQGSAHPDYATHCAVTGTRPRTLTPFYLSIGLGLLRDAFEGLPADLALAAVNEFTGAHGIDVLLTEWRRAHPLWQEGLGQPQPQQQQQQQRPPGASPLHRLSMLNMLRGRRDGVLAPLSARIVGAIDEAVASIFAYLLQHDTQLSGCRRAIAVDDIVVLTYLAEEAAFVAKENTLRTSDAVALLRALLLRPVGEVLVELNKVQPLHTPPGCPAFRIPLSAAVCQLHDLLVREDTAPFDLLNTGSTASGAPGDDAEATTTTMQHQTSSDIVTTKRAEARRVVAQAYLRQNIGAVVCRVMVMHVLPEPEEARLAASLAYIMEAGYRAAPDQAMQLASGLLSTRSAAAMRLLAVLFRHFSAEEIAVVCGGKRSGAVPLHETVLFGTGIARTTLRYDEESLADFEHWLTLLSCFAAATDEAEAVLWARGVVTAAQLRLELLPNHINYMRTVAQEDARGMAPPPKLKASSPLHPESFLYVVGGRAPEVAWEARKGEILRGMYRMGSAHAEAAVEKRDQLFGLGYMEQVMAEYEPLLPHLPVRKESRTPRASPKGSPRHGSATPSPRARKASRSRRFPPVQSSPSPKNTTMQTLPLAFWNGLEDVSCEGASLIAALRVKSDGASWRDQLLVHRVPDIWAYRIDDQRSKYDCSSEKSPALQELLIRFCNFTAQIVAYLATHEALPLLNSIGRVLAAVALDDLYSQEEAAVTVLDATLNFVTAHPDDLQMSGVLFSAILSLYELQQSKPTAIPASFKPRLAGIFSTANIDWNAARDGLLSEDEDAPTEVEEEEEEEEEGKTPRLDPHSMTEAEYLEHVNANAYYDMLTQRLLEKRPACGGNPLQTIKELKCVLEELERAREREAREAAMGSDAEDSLQDWTPLDG